MQFDCTWCGGSGIEPTQIKEGYNFRFYKNSGEPEMPPPRRECEGHGSTKDPCEQS